MTGTQTKVVLRKKLTREQLLPFLANQPVNLIAVEAGCGAHHWTRSLSKLGHKVRLTHPKFVRPFVKTKKNDWNDAAAICEVAAADDAVCGGEVVGVKGPMGVAPDPESFGCPPDCALAELERKYQHHDEAIKRARADDSSVRPRVVRLCVDVPRPENPCCAPTGSW